MGSTGVSAKQTSVSGAGSRIVVIGAAAEAQAGQNLSDMLANQLDRARVVARERAADKSQTRTAARLHARGIKPAASDTSSRNNIVGLVGEILTENGLKALGAGKPFYVKWRVSGTSTSAGVDMVFKQGSILSACESKHLHSLIRNAPAPVTPVAGAVNKALGSNLDAHTEDFLGKLLMEEYVLAAKLDSRGDEAGRIQCLERRDVLEAALSAGAYATNVMVAFDSAYSLTPAAVRSRIKSNITGLFKNPVTCFLMGVLGLYNSTEAMVSRYGP